MIGIIALLISILLPALNKARSAANGVACAANLRSIGQGFALYANANRGYVPSIYMEFAPDRPAVRRVAWTESIGKFMGFKSYTSVYGGTHDARDGSGLPNPVYMGPPKGPFLCPANQEMFIHSNLNYNGSYPLPDPPTVPISGRGWSSYVINAKMGGSNANNTPNNAKPGFVHLLAKGSAEVYLAFDGQASWIVGTDRVANPNAAGNHCERSDAICPIATTAGEIIHNRGIAAFRHGSRLPAAATLNMLYCDGHVAEVARTAMPSKLNNNLSDIGNRGRGNVDWEPPWFPLGKNSGSLTW
ncbi:MAG: hypothetical protein WBD40_09610 [Tepidisphaeraceae bacterium]